jgi:pyruvate formate lyase activating enzyme
LQKYYTLLLLLVEKNNGNCIESFILSFVLRRDIFMKNCKNSVTARYWHSLEDGRLQCDLCPRGCKLQDQQQGACFVRSRQGSEIILATYGRSSGFCIDPIEKKPLYHFLPGSPILSFGTAGCNLACKFCQNWDISTARETDILGEAVSPAQVAEAARKHECRSVAFTYNEPIIFLEYAVDIAKECHHREIKTVAVTAGYICEDPRREFFRYMDAANVDLKSFSDSFYRNLCGAALQPVLDTLLYLKNETDVWLEITNLLIPGENDSEDELSQMTGWIADNLGTDVPVHFSAFHPAHKLVNKSPTTPAVLSRARKIALSNGLRYVYTGNVHDPEGGSTFCHNCSRKIIGRDWYVMSEYHLDAEGRCNYCNELCAGVFDGPAGDWGAKRVPVYI